MMTVKQKVTHRIERSTILLLFIAQATVLTMAIALFAFTHPMMDDFCEAADVRELGVINGLNSALTKNSSRWGSKLIEYIVPAMINPIKYYGIFPASIFIFLALGIYLFLISLFRRHLNISYIVLLFFSLISIYWVGMRSPAQSVYWWSGSVEYQITLATMFIIFAILFWVSGKDPGQRTTTIVTAGVCILTFCLPGLHELFGFILAILLWSGFLIAYRIESPNRHIWLKAATAAVLGLVLVLAIPGGHNRMASHDTSFQLGAILFLASRQGIFNIVAWSLDIKLLSATLLFVISFQIRAIRPAWFAFEGVNWSFIVPFIWVVLLVVAFLIPSIAIRKSMPYRTLNSIYMLFLVGWFATVFIFTRLRDDPVLTDSITVRWIRHAALVIFAVSLLATGNTPSAVKDVFVRGPIYNQAMHHRYQIINVAMIEGQDDVIVPQPSVYPKHQFRQGEIEEDKDNWKNQCVARYFSLNSIALRDAQ